MELIRPDSLSHSKQPLYQQLATVFRVKIDSGEWPPGTRLPALADLTAELGVGRVTVRSALDELAAEGLVSRSRGQGTFVRERPDAVDEKIELAYTWDALVDFGRHSSLEAVTEIADAALELPTWCRNEGTPAEQYHRLERIYLRGKRRVCFSLVYLASDLYERLRGELSTIAIATVLGETADIRIGRALQTLTITSAGDDTASKLRIPVGSPIAEIIRRVYAPDRRLIYWSRVHFPGKYVRMSFDLLEPREPDAHEAPVARATAAPAAETQR